MDQIRGSYDYHVILCCQIIFRPLIRIIPAIAVRKGAGGSLADSTLPKRTPGMDPIRSRPARTKSTFPKLA
ncbi:hypothetical protein D3C86_2156720 [compost metagenome]